jgi:two-component system response regulator FixJ
MRPQVSRNRGDGETDAAEAQRFPGDDRLTEREREVLSQITNGASNKEAGRRLGISPRTIEVHRARIMDKLGAKNAADLVRITLHEAQRT